MKWIFLDGKGYYGFVHADPIQYPLFVPESIIRGMLREIGLIESEDFRIILDGSSAEYYVVFSKEAYFTAKMALI